MSVCVGNKQYRTANIGFRCSVAACEYLREEKVLWIMKEINQDIPGR